MHSPLLIVCFETLPKGGFSAESQGCYKGLSKFRLCAPPPVKKAVHLIYLGDVSLPVLSGHNRTVHCHLVSPTCLLPLLLSSAAVPSFQLPTPLAVCLDPKSAATTHPATPTLAYSIFTDGSVKSGWILKMLFDFCSPLVPRPYGATGEKGRGLGTHSPTPTPTPCVSFGQLLHGISVKAWW